MTTYDSDSPVRIKGMAVYAATDKALLIARDWMDERSDAFNREKRWVPRSFLDHEDNELNELDDAGDLVLPRHMAEAKDWVNWEYVT